MLFDRISSDLGILCFHNGITGNTNNCVSYNGGSHEFIIVTLDMFLNELSTMLCNQLGYNMFEI